MVNSLACVPSGYFYILGVGAFKFSAHWPMGFLVVVRVLYVWDTNSLSIKIIFSKEMVARMMNRPLLCSLHAVIGKRVFPSVSLRWTFGGIGK